MTNNQHTPLGQAASYTDTYTPSLLFPMLRADSRPLSLTTGELPFYGDDLWHSYEFSWLDKQGKPQVAGLRFRIPATSTHMVESKSVKLYLNSFSQTRFGHRSEVLSTLMSDLKLATRSPVDVELVDLAHLTAPPSQFTGRCLDDLEVEVDCYQPAPDLLATASNDAVVHESVFTNLFRSVCPVTGQPDWASVQVEYRGQAIEQSAMLLYLISYRQHAAFHESTVEQIFLDVQRRCSPEELSVHACFQRRGGIDISPYRATSGAKAPVMRLPRQ